MIGELGLFSGIGGMRGEAQKPQQQAAGGGGRSGRFFPNSKRAISSYWRFVSSGASTVASTVRSAGASVASAVAADKDNDCGRDLVVWAGFDKLEFEENIVRQVLLLGYRTGFQVWDVEEANNVREIVCKQDGRVSFLQMQPKLMISKRSEDKFLGSRPLLVVNGDAAVNGLDVSHEGFDLRSNGSIPGNHELGNVNYVPTVVRFYSLKSHSYVHALKFRSAVYSVRCSARIVAVAQAAQIHCFDAATLESVYIVVTHPMVSGCHGPGSNIIGYGPLAVGSRWLAHTGNQVIVSSMGRVNPLHLTPPSNGSFVAHYAKESSRHLAAGIVTIGDMGYKKLSKYCSELLPDINNTHRTGSNGHYSDAEDAGFVIIRDVVCKSVVSQFKAHRSPISALCFDPSGTLLVTASVQGHNLNVFRITPPPGSSSASDLTTSCIHLYRLQRGLTNAIIQDITFSNDSKWVMISSSRGTSHLFSISPFGENLDRQTDDVAYSNNSTNDSVGSAVHQPLVSGPSRLSQQKLYESGLPVTLSAVTRIKNGNGWRDAVNGAAATATGRVSSVSGAVASAFHYCNGVELHEDFNSFVTKYHLLVFSPTGSVIQYAVRVSSGMDSGAAIQSVPNIGSHGSVDNHDGKLLVETLQKWDVCHMRNRIEREENIDTYYDHKSQDVNKVPRRNKNGTTGVHHSDKGSLVKEKPNPEESHHLYISKAELHMHQSVVPLWARPQIYFQVMVMDDIKTDHVDISCGEIEIGRIQTRSIEARTKNIVPAVDYPQGSNFQKPRAFDNRSMESLPHKRHGHSGDGKVSVQNSCSPSDVLPEADARTETDSSHPLVEENGWGDLLTSTELSGGFVNNCERPMKESSAPL